MALEPFPINQIVHLPGDGLATHTKDGTLAGSQKVHGAGLEGVIWVKHLLRHVKTVVGMDGSVVGWSLDDLCAAAGGGEKVLSTVK